MGLTPYSPLRYVRLVYGRADFRSSINCQQTRGLSVNDLHWDEAVSRLSSATAPLAEALHATLTRTPCSGRTMYLSKRLSPSFLLWLQNYRLPRRNFPSIGLWWSPGPYLYLAMHGRASLRWAKFHGALLFELVFLRAAFCIEAVNLCFSQGHGLR